MVNNDKEFVQLTDEELDDVAGGTHGRTGTKVSVKNKQGNKVSTFLKRASKAGNKNNAGKGSNKSNNNQVKL